MAARRVAVFIDYQNCYGAALEVFCTSTDPTRYGQIQPMALAHALAAKGIGPYALSYVGVYAGLPSGQKDPKTYAARRRQIAAWRNTGVTPASRPVRYPRDWPKAKP